MPAAPCSSPPSTGSSHDRDRAEALWGFRYRLEMYVPKAKREYGYYVLPFLVGDRVVGRIEPGFDRKAGTLQVLGTWGDTARLGRAAREPRALARRQPRITADGLRDPCHPCGPGAGSGHRRDHHADLPDVDVRARGGRRPQGIRLRARRNPTRTALQVALASLENAKHGIAFSSGSARRRR